MEKANRSFAMLIVAVIVVSGGATATFIWLKSKKAGQTSTAQQQKVNKPAPRPVPSYKNPQGVPNAVGGNFKAPASRRIRAIKVDSLRLWWDAIPVSVKQTSAETGDVSNIRPKDYSGPESCKKCHKENYESWTHHAHRWMNALATDETVKGDFSGEASISYLGGKGTFFRDGTAYRMKLERGDVTRLYEINQTIGSRFYQYYVGKQLEGPEDKGHAFYTDDHVLPFGFWLEKKEWVPVVHIQKELPDGEREDPFARMDDRQKPFFARYATSCNYCHTTFAFGDMLIRHATVQGKHAPYPLSLSMPSYLSDARPAIWSGREDPAKASNKEFQQIVDRMFALEAPSNAVTLGVSCEACHFGAKDHAEGKLKKPRFFPSSKHLMVETGRQEIDFGRTTENVNWACGRCHAGERSLYAGGMSTWNSTEYTDARRGACYSQLTCINCHNPHKGIGAKWTRTAEKDDASCLKCHKKYEAEADRKAHTHHASGSEGSRCMNCHMPRINEGMQDMVRTHTIFSPTKKEMIENNHPNACNQCHTDKSIDWTTKYLKDWYQATYDESAIAKHYAHRDKSVALGWLKSDHESVRMVGADSLVRTKAKWATPDLVNMLDDRFLLNRQFSQKWIEELSGLSLSQLGYRYYMTADERKAPIEAIRKKLLK